MKKKNVITWKDADQNLCTLAAALIDAAQSTLRSPFNRWYRVPENELEEIELAAGGLQILPDSPTDATGRNFPPGTWSENEGSPIWSHKFLSPQCHYAFMNLIRLHLKHQRLMLKRNLMGQSRRHRISGQSSRNATGRGRGSKFGRQSEP